MHANMTYKRTIKVTKKSTYDKSASRYECSESGRKFVIGDLKPLEKKSFHKVAGELQVDPGEVGPLRRKVRLSRRGGGGSIVY